MALSRLSLYTGADVSVVLPPLARTSLDGTGAAARQANVSVRPGQLPMVASADVASLMSSAAATLSAEATAREEESSAAEAELVAELAGEAADDFSRPGSTVRANTPAGLRLAEVSQQLVSLAARWVVAEGWSGARRQGLGGWPCCGPWSRAHAGPAPVHASHPAARPQALPAPHRSPARSLSPANASMLLEGGGSMVVPVLPASIYGGWGGWAARSRACLAVMVLLRADCCQLLAAPEPKRALPPAPLATVAEHTIVARPNFEERLVECREEAGSPSWAEGRAALLRPGRPAFMHPCLPPAPAPPPPPPAPPPATHPPTHPCPQCAPLHLLLLPAGQPGAAGLPGGGLRPGR